MEMARSNTVTCRQSGVEYFQMPLSAPCMWRCFISSRHLESDDQLHLELPDVDFEAQVEKEGLDGLVCDIDQPELL